MKRNIIYYPMFLASCPSRLGITPGEKYEHMYLSTSVGRKDGVNGPMQALTKCSLKTDETKVHGGTVDPRGAQVCHGTAFRPETGERFG